MKREENAGCGCCVVVVVVIVIQLTTCEEECKSGNANQGMRIKRRSSFAAGIEAAYVVAARGISRAQSRYHHHRC